MTTIPPPPDIPPTLALERLLHILTPAQLARFVEHCEDVNEHGWGEVSVCWEHFEVRTIYHRASDRV